MNSQESKDFIRHYVDVVWNDHDLEKAREYPGGDARPVGSHGTIRTRAIHRWRSQLGRWQGRLT